MVVKNMGIEAKFPEFDILFHPFLIENVGKLLTDLFLSFFICKMEIMIITPLPGEGLNKTQSVFTSTSVQISCSIMSDSL